MKTVSLQELQWLLGAHEPPCVSLYMPTHRHHPGTEQDPIRYRGLLRRAAELLGSKHRSKEVRGLLEPLDALDNPEFWRHQRDGLAVFRAPEVCANYRLPRSVPELAVVADTFHTKPLIRLLHRNRRFHLLALSQNETSLWSGTREGVQEMDLADLRGDLRSLLGPGERGKHLDLHAAGRRTPIYHGHGPGDEDRKEQLERYFREIDRAIRKHLRDERAPLVLAAVDYYHPIYRSVSRYPYLLEEGLTGNFERVSAQELHDAAWPLVAEEFVRHEEEVLARYRERAATSRASDKVPAVATSVVHGRVAELLVAEDRQAWGILDRDTGRVEVHDRQQGPEDADLLDDLAELTLIRGGEVLVLAPERMPSESPIAALYRW